MGDWDGGAGAAALRDLLWVAALSVLVLMEKSGPAGLIIARVAGAATIAFGGMVAFRN